MSDSAEWFRYSRDDILEHRDGLTLETVGLPPFTLLVTKLLPRASKASIHKTWLHATQNVHVATAPIFGLVAVRDLYDRPQTIRAGKLWQRLHLWPTARGIAMHPLNQMMEMADREHLLAKPPKYARLMSDLMGTHEWKPTFGFPMGYAAKAAMRTPRRPVEHVLT